LHVFGGAGEHDLGRKGVLPFDRELVFAGKRFELREIFGRNRKAFRELLSRKRRRLIVRNTLGQFFELARTPPAEGHHHAKDFFRIDGAEALRLLNGRTVAAGQPLSRFRHV
jgi:hypothetical protein